MPRISRRHLLALAAAAAVPAARSQQAQQEQLIELLQLLTGELEEDARAAFVPPTAPSR